MSKLRNETDTGLMDAIDLVIIAVRAGLTPIAAIESTAAFCPPQVRAGFDDVVHRFHRGSTFADALAHLTAAIGPSAGEFTDALAHAERAGLPIVPVLDQLARDTRERRRRLTSERVRSLPVALTFPMVTCTLPSFVLLTIAPVLLGAITSLSNGLP